MLYIMGISQAKATRHISYLSNSRFDILDEIQSGVIQVRVAYDSHLVTIGSLVLTE